MADAQINIEIKTTIWLQAAKLCAMLNSRWLLKLIKDKPIAYTIIGKRKEPVYLSKYIKF